MSNYDFYARKMDQESGSVAAGLCREAAGIVEGVRNSVHGHKERSFPAIAAMWTAYLNCRKEPGSAVRPHDVAHMLVLMKQQRAEWGEAVRDHWTDQIGYAATAGELALGVEKQ